MAKAVDAYAKPGAAVLEDCEADWPTSGQLESAGSAEGCKARPHRHLEGILVQCHPPRIGPGFWGPVVVGHF